MSTALKKPTMGTLMVPLDGSPLSEAAIPMAAALARHGRVTIHLVSVPPPAPWAPRMPADVTEALERDASEQARQYLASKAAEMGTCFGLEATPVVLDGAPAEALAHYARSHEIGLIVMTTHGRSGLGRLWLGSVADRLLRRATTPILLLRSKHQPQHTELRHVLVALDGSPASETVLERALALVSLYPEACCSLAQIIEPPSPQFTELVAYPEFLDPELVSRQQASAKKDLERLSGSARKLGMSVTTHTPVSLTVGSAVLELAHELGCDLIAIGTHGRRGLERALLGSVADKVIRGATQAVLVVPVAAHQE